MGFILKGRATAEVSKGGSSATQKPVCFLLFRPKGASIRWPGVLWLGVGAVPSAYLGALVLPLIPADLVMALIAGLMLIAGFDSLRKAFGKIAMPSRSIDLAIGQFIAIGAVTGFGSAISGTGGPLILVPILIYLGMPVLTAVGLAQAIQIPIASFATVGNWMGGNLDLELALTISVVLVAGTLIGAVVIHRLPEQPIRKFVSVFIVFTALAIGIRLIASLL